MPFPNEHACRIHDPKLFQADSFRRMKQTSDGKPLVMIIAKLKGETSTTLQSYRYPKDSWSAKDARKHCGAHAFEPAAEQKSDNGREVRVCTSPEMRVAERADDQPGLPTLTGYAALFNTLSEPIAYFRERIQRGAFRESLKSGDDVRALVEHEGGLSSLGRTSSGTLSLAEDDTGLRVEIQPPDTQAGRDTVELVRRGDLSQMSFAFRTIDDEWHTEDGETVRELRKAQLFDVSVVSFPAYPDTSVAVRAAEQYAAALNEVDRHALLKRRLDLRRRFDG